MSFLRRESKNKKRRKVLVVLDFENIMKALERIPPRESFSIVDGLDKMIKKIAQDIGEIVNVYVFVPVHLAYHYAEMFHKANCFTIVCPKIKGKIGEDIDTTDEILKNFGRSAIRDTQGLTDICIGSGDKDFTSLAREAISRGLVVTIVAGSTHSLASEMIKISDRVIFFNPTST